MARRRAAAEADPLRLVDVASAESVGGPADSQDVVGEPFEAFYRREFPRLVALAHGLAGPALAADIAQEAMIAAFRRWDEVQSFDSAERLGSRCVREHGSVGGPTSIGRGTRDSPPTHSPSLPSGAGARMKSFGGRCADFPAGRRRSSVCTTHWT